MEKSSFNILTIALTAIITAACSVGGFSLYLQGQSPSAEKNSISLNSESSKASIQTQPAVLGTEQTPVSTLVNSTSAPSAVLLSDEEIPAHTEIFYLDSSFYELITYRDGLQKLLKEPTGGKREVVLKNVREESPELDRYGISYEASTNGKIIFSAYVPESDSGVVKYVSFDTTTKKFSDMKINEIYKGSYEPQKASQSFLAYAPNTDSGTEKLYVIDLLHDSYKTVANLKTGESFNAGSGGFMSFSNIEWLGDRKIRFAVFDKKQQEKFDYDNPYKGLIEYREVNF